MAGRMRQGYGGPVPRSPFCIAKQSLRFIGTEGSSYTPSPRRLRRLLGAGVKQDLGG